MRLLVLIILGLAGQIHAEGILVAASSDLQFVIPELIAKYETTHPDAEIGTTFGSSGKFYEQIESGAPFDLFLSADSDLPKKLIADGKGAEADFFFYATGHLVLWALRDSPLDFDKKDIRVAVDSKVKKLAIANPEHAPYGRAAIAALKKLGLYDLVKDRLVLGENVVQAAQFVQTGAADAGLIGLSLASAPQMREKGKYIEVPVDSYPRIDQAGLVLNTPHAATARLFRDWLQSPEAAVVWKSYGFTLNPQP